MSEPFSSEALTSVRRRRWLAAIGRGWPILSVPLALAFVVWWFADRTRDTPGGLVWLVFIGVSALISRAYRRIWWPLREQGRVRADRAGVTIGDRFVPRAEIQRAFVMPGDRPFVVLERGRLESPEQIETGSVDEARALLRALGWDASQKLLETKVRSPLHAWIEKHKIVPVLFVILWFAGAFVFQLMSRFGPLGLLAPYLPMILVGSIPAKLTVGADGVVLRWLGTHRFISHGEIAGLTLFDNGGTRYLQRQLGVDLTLRSGEKLRLSTVSANEDEAVLLHERLGEARDTFQQGGAGALALLSTRGERSMQAWVAALRAMGAGANADARTAPVSREQLFRIVEDPSSAPLTRAASAAALGADLDDESRARLRVAAEGAAQPRLRVAIDRVASGEDAEIEAALAEIEADEGTDRAKSRSSTR